MHVVVNSVSLCAVWPLWGLCPGREEGALSYSFYLSAKQAWSMGLHPPSLQHPVGREMNAVSAQLAWGKEGQQFLLWPSAVPGRRPSDVAVL